MRHVGRAGLLLLAAVALHASLSSVGADGPEKSGQPEDDRRAKRPWHALMVMNVAPGQIHGMYELLAKRYKCLAGNITVLGDAAGEAKILRDMISGPATKERIFAELDRLGKDLTERDSLLVVFACHMKPGFVINADVKYEELNGRLAKFRRGTRLVVVLEGCHSGGAIPVIRYADVLYTAATKDEKSYGGFLMFLVDALGRGKEDMQAADADKDGRVSLAEAYAFASDRERLAKWYKTLPKEVWPTDAVPTPMRNMLYPGLDSGTWLSPR